MYTLSVDNKRITIDSKNYYIEMQDFTKDENSVIFQYIFVIKKTGEKFNSVHMPPNIKNIARNTQEIRDFIKIIEDIKFYLSCMGYFNTLRRYPDNEKLLNKAYNEVKNSFNTILQDINDIADFKKRMKEIRKKY